MTQVNAHKMNAAYDYYSNYEDQTEWDSFDEYEEYSDEEWFDDESFYYGESDFDADDYDDDEYEDFWGTFDDDDDAYYDDYQWTEEDEEEFWNEYFSLFGDDVDDWSDYTFEDEESYEGMYWIGNSDIDRSEEGSDEDEYTPDFSWYNEDENVYENDNSYNYYNEYHREALVEDLPIVVGE